MSFKNPIASFRNPMRYVVALLFSADGSHIVLLEKDHPEWQKGKWNGPGGKIEVGETPEGAVSREVMEETGVYVAPKAWEMCLILHGEQYSACFLRAFTDKAYEAKTMETEKVLPISTGSVHKLTTIPNLQWIVPLALDRNLHVPIRIWDNHIAGKQPKEAPLPEPTA